MTICYIILTKLQLIVKIEQGFIFAVYWYKDCLYNKQFEIIYV